VEGLPGIASPLDPEAGLGGIVSLGLFPAKASVFFENYRNP
jgi:hypothetical protein